MQRSRQVFQEALERRQRLELRGRQSELKQVAQAVVPITKLTESKEWDFFLSILEAKIEEVETALNAVQDSAVLNPSFAAEDMAAIKADQLLLWIQKHTLEQVSGLPKQILERGEAARLALYEPDES